VAQTPHRVWRDGGVNDQLWWYLARSAGLAAAALMVGALVLGALAATRALKDIDRPAWLVALHRWFSVLTAIAVATHLAALVADNYTHFGVAELLVPGTSSWRPFAVSLGVVALYTFVIVHVSSVAMKRLPKVWWRRLHALSYLSVWAAIMHAGTAGTDATNVLYRAVATLLTMAAVMAALLRVVLGRYAVRAAAGRRGSAEATRATAAVATDRGE
jgi:predicted ferric reductase